MSRIFFVLMFLVISVGAMAQTTGPVITWEKPTHDFGDITQGDKVEHTFSFKNSGNEPLIITNVQVTCGCTTPKGWARDPILPGQSGEITVAFNSLGKYGKQNKVVTIVSNAVNSEGTQVVFTANVLEKKAPN
ncbi:MAG: DUF1573 domain-containing protein [Cyclobacteriaceae bacterium]|nr:DUF1573 domain-containing protein [Cyclobacteriaceae bacterium]